ncbi:DMT family transporter [Deferrisoma camini]|uniref:DMT family transporter n=1 Tax=Deferrisoma camini TaxID=1035120 RepID=UPI00046CEA73|nr:DMT family transporter [Deferrisoma camini]
MVINRGLYVRLAGAAVLWGGTFVAGRLLAAEVSPAAAAFVRFALAGAVLAALAWREGEPVAWTPRTLGWFALLGLTGVAGYNLLFFTGLRTVEAGRAALIIANNPVAIAAGAALVLGERLGLRASLGIGVAVVGACVVVSRGHPLQVLRGGVGVGELCIAGCVVCWTAYTLIGRRALAGLSPLQATAGACVVGAAILAGPALAGGLARGIGAWSATAWASALYLALGGTVLAFVWYYRGVQALGAARAGVFINLVPVSGVVFGWLFLGERLDPSVWVGGALVATGIALTRTRAEAPPVRTGSS